MEPAQATGIDPPRRHLAALASGQMAPSVIPVHSRRSSSGNRKGAGHVGQAAEFLIGLQEGDAIRVHTYPPWKMNKMAFGQFVKERYCTEEMVLINGDKRCRRCGHAR